MLPPQRAGPREDNVFCSIISPPPSTDQPLVICAHKTVHIAEQPHHACLKELQQHASLTQWHGSLHHSHNGTDPCITHTMARTLASLTQWHGPLHHSHNGTDPCITHTMARTLASLTPWHGPLHHSHHDTDPCITHTMTRRGRIIPAREHHLSGWMPRRTSLGKSVAGPIEHRFYVGQ
jgi:hypothetical protein